MWGLAARNWNHTDQMIDSARRDLGMCRPSILIVQPAIDHESRECQQKVFLVFLRHGDVSFRTK